MKSVWSRLLDEDNQTRAIALVELVGMTVVVALGRRIVSRDQLRDELSESLAVLKGLLVQVDVQTPGLRSLLEPPVAARLAPSAV